MLKHYSTFAGDASPIASAIAVINKPWLEALISAGASKVFACASHPVLSGQAIERIAKSKLEQVVVTNTIPLTEQGKSEPKVKVLSIAGLLGRAIQSIHEETSVSSLFA